MVEPLTVATNGDYWLGDMGRGVWSAPTGCFWEKVAGFRGANLWDVEQSGRSPEKLVVDVDDESNFIAKFEGDQHTQAAE